MYSIDYVDCGNGTVKFTHDYHALIDFLNLNIDTGILESNVIDEDEFIYDGSMINNHEYNDFIIALNNAIVNVESRVIDGTEMIIDCDIDENNLIVNGINRGSNKHISKEDIDLMIATHVADYFNGNDVDIDSANIYEIAEMIQRFIYIVRLMNGYAY